MTCSGDGQVIKSVSQILRTQPLPYHPHLHPPPAVPLREALFLTPAHFKMAGTSMSRIVHFGWSLNVRDLRLQRESEQRTSE